MIIDSVSLPKPFIRSTDIAIVGSGPAAITLAKALSSNNSVLLLEAGGPEASESALDCLKGTVSGINYPLSETRARQFGGSTSIWAGYCAIFDELDFRHRPWIQYSGWPIDYKEITDCYQEAATCLHVDDACFDPTIFGANEDYSFNRINEHKFSRGIWRFGATKANFAQENRDLLRTSNSIDVLVNSCVTTIQLTQNCNAVSRLGVRTTNGTSGTIQAKCFILAAGGIETPRLMLSSNEQSPKGVGNTQDQVGRYFMEHPHVSIEGIEMKESLNLDAWTQVTRSDDNRKFTFCAGLKEKSQKEFGILNARTHFFRTPSMGELDAPKIGIFFEQAPNPNSRLTLTDKLDQFGMPRVNLHWEISEIDKRSHNKLCKVISEELLNRGLALRTGKVFPSEEILYSNHQLGTTRMATSPNEGVVDSNCKVHGIENLYIAGGSVFPTVSWANPTMTVLALSIRLAKHLTNKVLH